MTIERVGGHMVRVERKSDVVAEWWVYEILGERDGVPLFWRAGSASSMDPTEDLAEAEPSADGYVKWDGCGHMRAGTDDALVHVCGTEAMESLLNAVKRAHGLAADLVGAED